MKILTLLCCLIATWLSAADEAGIALADGTWECHGTAQLPGQATAERFWLRLMPPDKKFGRNRMLQVVYTPPLPATVGGTHLADTPFLLLDARARLVAWNDRGSNTLAQPGKETYVVTRDRTPGDHTDLVLNEQTFTGERGWDRTAVPLLLTIAWHAGTTATLPCVDLFGDQPATTVSWAGEQVTMGTVSWRIEADAHGRLKSLRDVQGTALISVSEWLTSGATTSPGDK